MNWTWGIPRKYRVWLLLACGTVLYFFANLQRVAVPGAIFNELQRDLGVGASGITGLGTAFMAIYALSHLVVGVMVDRYGGFRVIAWGACMFCIGALLFPFAGSPGMLYLSRAVVGVGASTLWLSMVKETARAFPKNFTVVFGGVLLLGYMGGVVANAPLILCVNEIGWRSVFKIIAVAMIVAYGAFLLVKTTVAMPEKHRVPLNFKPYWALLKLAHNRHLFLFAGLNFSLYYVIQTVLGKKFLEDFSAMTPEAAAVVLSTMGVISGAANFGFAALSRACGNRRRIFVRLAALVSLAMYLVIAAAVACEYRTILVAVCFLILTLAGNLSPITVSLIRETNDAAGLGVAVSCSNMIAYLLVAMLANAAGHLMDLFAPARSAAAQAVVYPPESYLAVFGMIVLLSGFSLWNAWQLPETRGRNIAAELHGGK